MRKFLSIVIPRYNESEKLIFNLLSSINGQIGVDLSDLEIIISNDGGSKELHKDFLGLFDMDMKQINLSQNKGPGVARQVGLDNAKGEYVMFCDADDVLHSVGVLGALIQEAEKTAADMISSSWLEEVLDENGSYHYITHEIENTWMHGKLFRRQFLIQNNIRFHEELRLHEDSYFLAIAAALAKNRTYIPVTTYVWKYRRDSITRSNDAAYTYYAVPDFIQSCAMAHEIIEKLVPEQMEYKTVQFIIYNFFGTHQAGWEREENKKYRENAEKAIVKYFKPFWKYWQNASKETITRIYNEERNKTFSNYIETETIWEWINRIGVESN